MASQSLPPPPLTCSTPPPIDFGPDDDDDPFPDDDEDQSEELPSIGDEAIPDAIPEDTFFYSSPEGKSTSPRKEIITGGIHEIVPSVLQKEEPPEEKQKVEQIVPETILKEESKPEPSTSIHDLLNRPDKEEEEERVGEEPPPLEAELKETESISSNFLGEEEDSKLNLHPAAITSDLNVDLDIDNPPSLILDVNFNVTPTTPTKIDGNGNLDEEFGDFSTTEEFKALPGDEQLERTDSIATPEGELTVPTKVEEDSVGETEEFHETFNIPELAAETPDDDEFGDFVENEAGDTAAIPPTIDQVTDVFSETVAESENCDFKGNNLIEEQQCVQQDAAIEDKDDEFDDFTDFTTPTEGVAGQPPAATTIEWEEKGVETATAIEFEADFNQFANFENFPTATIDTGETVEEERIVVQQAQHRRGSLVLEASEDDDDDDFGDFTSSVPVPAVQPPATAAAPAIAEKMSEIDISNVDGILKEMFPESAIGDNSIPSTIFQSLLTIAEYETTALTNEYQWTKSCSNKCLVKCLGIDTRNILHGTTWNSEMPRFAANLGFTPLQPLKTTGTGTGGAVGITTGTTLKPISVAGQSTTVASGNAGTDAVPAAQFDWDSSGLVNPLHALQAHTYLLDLEQLVVVARLENTKTASNNNFPVIDAAAASAAAPAPDSTSTIDGDSSTWSLAMDSFSRGQGMLLTGGGGDLMEHNANDYDKYSPFRTIYTREESCAAKKSLEPVIPSSGSLATAAAVLDLKADLAISLEEKDIIRDTVENDLTALGVLGGKVLESKVPIESTIEMDAVKPPPFTSPLRETHIFTPMKGVGPVSREISSVGSVEVITTATAAALAESIAVKEYRDVEYDPSKFLEISSTGVVAESESNSEFGDFQTTTNKVDFENELVVNRPENEKDEKILKGPDLGNIGKKFSIDEEEEEEDDDFTEFQSVPAATSQTFNQSQSHSTSSLGSSIPLPIMSKQGVGLAPIIPSQPIVQNRNDNSTNVNANPLQVLSVNNLSSMATAAGSSAPAANNKTNHQQENILMPSILMPKPVGGGGNFASQSVFEMPKAIRWPDNSGQEIEKSELERIEELFAGNRQNVNGGGIYNNNKGMSLEKQHQEQKVRNAPPQEEDEWTDFVSVADNKITSKSKANEVVAVGNSGGDDDWTDFVSSAPQQQATVANLNTGPNFIPWGAPNNYQPQIPTRPMTHLPPPRLNSGTTPEMQFVDPSPFFISSAATGLQSMFSGLSQGMMGNGGSNSGVGGRNNLNNAGRK